MQQVVLYSCAQIIYNVWFHPLSKIPGPKSFAATRLMYCHTVIKGNLVNTIERLHQRYGKIVRIAPDEISVIDGDAWKPIYGTRPGHGQKTKDFRFYPETIDNAPSIIKSNDADHSRFRRLLSHAFSDHSLQAQESMIRGYVDLLIQRLHEKSGANGAILDMVSWFNFTTFDIIGDMAFGEPFGSLQQSSYHSWVAYIFGNIKVGTYNNVLTRFPGASYILSLVVPAKLRSQKKSHEEMTKSRVQARLWKPNDRPDFFSNILKHSGTEKGFSDSELATNASTLVIAGSETTATFLSGAVFYLLKNPRVLQKLQAEVRSTFASDSEITLATTSKLVYMPAVISETFRMHPPVPVGLPRIVDPQGEIVAGHLVPGGTIVSLPQYAAYHSNLNFLEPYSYVPERFLDDPKFANDQKNVLQPFSFGPRNCIGRNLALVEIRLILSRLIFNFDMELDARSENWTDQKVYFLWEKPPLYVKLISRQHCC
ncbi:hypothetical protein BBP40_005973 [Aspergillus hancockii]|nr:hypothetical protein BBP40_005973 [Aspergillus hancockii]